MCSRLLPVLFRFLFLLPGYLDSTSVVKKDFKACFKQGSLGHWQDPQDHAVSHELFITGSYQVIQMRLQCVFAHPLLYLLGLYFQLSFSSPTFSFPFPLCIFHRLALFLQGGSHLITRLPQQFMTPLCSIGEGGLWSHAARCLRSSLLLSSDCGGPIRGFCIFSLNRRILNLKVQKNWAGLCCYKISSYLGTGHMLNYCHFSVLKAALFNPIFILEVKLKIVYPIEGLLGCVC